MATVSDHTTLDCPLCFKTFTTPRVLPCFHTFCEKCLGDYIESIVQGGSNFACPLCAAETVPSDSKLAIDKWASTFPLNTLFCALMEPSLDIDDDKCEPCKVDEEIKIAEFWCADCQEKLCSSCNRSHKRGKQLKYHKVVPIDEREKHRQSNINFDQECGCHGDKVKLFCVDHRKMCCPVCVAIDHRRCNDVRSIDDIARDQSQLSTSYYPGIIQDIIKIKTEMDTIMTEKKSNATQILYEKGQIFQDLDNRIDRIINHLNQLRNTFKKEADQLHQDTEKSMMENQKTLQSFMTNVVNSRDIMEVVVKTGTPQQKFTTVENIRSQIASHYVQLESKLKDDVKVHFSMKPDKLLDNVEGSLNSVGSVNANSKSSATSRDALQSTNKIMENLNSRTKINTKMCAAQVEKVKDLMTSPVTFVKTVTKDQLGRGAWFTGGTCLGNGRLMMCDRNSRRLVELDDEYNVVKEYKIEGPPTDVAAGNQDNEIYIGVYGNYIYKCTLNTDLTIVSRIEAPSGTWGIAVSGDNIIVSTTDAVVILTQDGSTVRSIPKSGYHSYVAVSEPQRTIYHKDDHDVVCRTWEGRGVFRYQHQHLKGLRGMCMDKYNNVYICGVESHNVHQVSHDWQRSRIIQLHNISEPCSVILHHRKNQLIITAWDENTVCEIYRFG